MSDVAVRVDSDSFGRVESHGIDAIPAPERHGAPRELAFLWAGAFVNYASLFTASLLTTYYGLGVWDGLLATGLGTIAAALILGLLSNTGPRSGEPQIVYTRRIFGLRGSYLGAGLTLFLAIGWFAVDCVIAAQAGAQLAGGGNRWITLGLVLVIAAISVAVAIYGHETIKVLATYGAIAFAALSLALFIFLAPHFHWSQGPVASGSDYPGAFVLGFMTCFALVASWYPFASDYSRYLPGSSATRSVTLWTVAGVVVPMLLLGLFGLLLPTIDASLAAGRRWQTALGCGLLGTALASYAVLVSDFHLAYEDFLILTYLWAPAWAAVVLLTFFFFEGRPRPRLALAAWLAGTAASLIFVNYGNLFSNLAGAPTFFNSGLVSALHGADLSGLISVAVAAAVYWSRLRSKR